MIDCNIVGGNWIEVPAGSYRKVIKSMSYCQLEVDCLYPFLQEAENYFIFLLEVDMINYFILVN